MDNYPLIIDIGTSSLKMGFGGEDIPKCVIPSIVGLKKRKEVIGDKIDTSLNLKLTYALERGSICNLNAFESVLEYAVKKKMKCKMKDFNGVLMAEHPLNPKRNREILAKLFFEKYNLPEFYVQLSPILLLYSSGRTTGIVLDVGGGCMSLLSVIEGYTPKHTVQRQNIGGNDVDKYLVSLLKTRGFKYKNDSSIRVIKKLKENICVTSLNGWKDLRRQKRKTPEILFNPRMINFQMLGCHQMLWESISNSHIYNRKTLMENIIISGGPTLCEGFERRLKKEMKSLIPKKVKSRINPVEDKINSVWIGGSIIGSLTTYGRMWVSKEEYKEYGVNVVNRKCFS